MRLPGHVYFSFGPWAAGTLAWLDEGWHTSQHWNAQVHADTSHVYDQQVRMTALRMSRIHLVRVGLRW